LRFRGGVLFFRMLIAATTARSRQSMRRLALQHEPFMSPEKPQRMSQDESMNDLTMTRRRLLATLPLAGAGITPSFASEPDKGGSALQTAEPATVAGLRFSPTPTVRIGIIGVGGRGMSLLENFLAVEGVRVAAICDLSAAHAREARTMAEKAGNSTPQLYTGGASDFENLCRRDDIDLVVLATPWSWHVGMAVYAMKQGKHVAVEVPMATSVEDCWKLVHMSEQSRRHCIMLENCCYGYNELLMLNLVRDGKLGELTHGAGGYLHDLRAKLASETDRLWMRDEYVKRNGNLYPTHGLGPIASYMGINRGDRLVSLVSVSSRGSSFASIRRVPPVFRCGDQNTSIIRTSKGLLITLEHNVATPEPYDRLNMIAGTRGVFRDFPPRLFLDGETSADTWETLDRYKAKYEHRLWTLIGEKARESGGHDGVDYVMCYRLVECMREGLAPDMDVYDGAAWSAAGPLSEMSVASGGTAVPFPDFTRGGWRQRVAPGPSQLRPASRRDERRS
jgi:predicted dehydrogenase